MKAKETTLCAIAAATQGQEMTRGRVGEFVASTSSRTPRKSMVRCRVTAHGRVAYSGRAFRW